MVSLEKIFKRFPRLTDNQRTELARRRVVRLFHIAHNVEPLLDYKLDIYHALEFLGTKNLFRSYK